MAMFVYRKVEETIVIKSGELEGTITVSVLAIERQRVKLGINAPPGVSILREELLRKGAGSGQDAQIAPV